MHNFIVTMIMIVAFTVKLDTVLWFCFVFTYAVVNNENPSDFKLFMIQCIVSSRLTVTAAMALAYYLFH